MPRSEGANNLPVHTVRHRRLKAAIWQNQTDKGAMYNVTISRSYQDKTSGQWHDSSSFGYDDLMNMVALLVQAHAYISALNAGEVKTVKGKTRGSG